MAPIPLKQAFTEARDRLLAITALAMPELVQVRPFADTQGVVMPYAEVVIPSGQLPAMQGGQQEITLNLEVRVWCDEAAAGSDGELQNMIYFDWLPSITEVYIKYGRLAYPDQPTFPSWINPAKTGLQRMQVILEQQWIMVFYWQITFKTAFICM